MKYFKADYLWKYLVALIGIAGVAHFIGLESAVPGFYVDESGVAAHITCLRQTGTDVWGEILPLFSMVVAGGSTTAPYMYSGVLWTGLFGDSVTAFRSLPAFYSILTMLGLFQLGTVLFRDKKAGLLCALAASVSPWAFQFARISWDAGIAPCFVVWGCYFALRAEQRIHSVTAGILLVLAMYTYPPVRVHVVLLAPFLLYLKYSREPGRRSLELAGIAFLSALVLGIPLIQSTLMGGEFTSRAKMLSVFSDYYLVQFGGFSYARGFQAFGENMISFFRPSYLFLTGDSNLRHSTQSFGILGPLDIFALASSFIAFRWGRMSKDDRRVLGFLVAGYILGLVPAALTWESNPHSLRSFSAEPFAALLVGWVLFKLTQTRAVAVPIIAAVATGSLAALMYVHLAVYPTKAAIWFDKDIATLGKQKKSAQEWEKFMSPELDYPRISRQYYLMAYGTGICVPQLPKNNF